MVDGFAKNRKTRFTSFRQNPESSKFNHFWIPDQVRHDGFRTFYEFITVDLSKNE